MGAVRWAFAAVTTIWLGGYLVAVDAVQEQAAVPTFTKDVAPILYRNCTSCHRPGEIGPMPLLTYDDARPYATSIKEEVLAGHMPPWHAEAPAGTFLDERRLTDEDKQTIVRWVDGGAPRGEASDLPPAPSYPEGWTIGTPDAVVEMPVEYEVPAEGEIEYQYFEVPTSFTEDTWIQAVEVRPGARDVVHHVLVYAREPADSGPARPRTLVPVRSAQGPPRPSPEREGEPRRQPRRLGALVGTTAPGTNAMTLPPGTALQIRAGAVLIFQVHYTATGRPVKDRSSIGFVFAREAPAAEARAASFVNNRFVIPAGADNHRVDAEVGFAEDAWVYALLPHTHLRGVRWEYQLVYPDGRTEPIFSVPRYDFNWQTYYRFAKPLEVARGSKIISSAWYDNSARNPSNPDPKSDVRWGDQTWEEMQYTGIIYSRK